MGTILILIASSFAFGSAAPYIEGMKLPCYALQKDLNLVLFVGMGFASGTDQGMLRCSLGPGHMFWSKTGPSNPEAFVYAINQVNSRLDLLPNITLGFIIIDNCYQDLAGLASSLYLVPDPDDPNYFPDDEFITCEAGYRRFRNVVGTVGPGSSKVAVMTAGLFSLFNIPMLLTTATSDDLSDKSRFPYSLRLVPPDKFQADAMTDLLLHFNWTYVSLLYEEGSYGENGAKQIQKKAKEKGICLAFTYMFPNDIKKTHIIEAVDGMIIHRKARIIITFMTDYIYEIAHELSNRGEVGYFVWMGSDSFSWNGKDYINIFDGAFAVRFPLKSESPEFMNYYNSLTPQTSYNPWLRRIWESEHNCEWGTLGNMSCDPLKNMSLDMRIPSKNVRVRNIDGVSVFAEALHSLIEKRCPAAFEDKSLLRSCVKGALLLGELLNTSTEGFLGPIRFDDKGDFLGSFEFVQFQWTPNNVKRVVGAVWNRLAGTLNVSMERLRWFSYLDDANISNTLPESVCSRPCGTKEYYIQKELPCCWDCRRCRDNEILIGNKTGCKVCELLTWPDDESATTCSPIEPTVLQWNQPLTLTLGTLAAIGIIFCLTTSLIFIWNKSAKIVKASSYQLMALILMGILVAFVTAIILLLRPSLISCFLSRFGFNMAVSLIYGPLVVKTSRIYRIFTAGKQGSKRPVMVSNRSQGIIVVVLLLLQVGYSKF